MIALTTRLNERDETIIQLQEELDAYDRIHRETEDMLEVRTNRVGVLENLLKNKGIQLPAETMDRSVIFFLLFLELTFKLLIILFKYFEFIINLFLEKNMKFSIVYEGI